MSKPTFFKTLSYLQGLGLIFLAKKKANRSYTYEVKHLLADPDVVSQILEKHLRTERSTQPHTYTYISYSSHRPAPGERGWVVWVGGWCRCGYGYWVRWWV